MKKVYAKLIALSLTLALSVCMVVAASYAWYVMSGSPELTGLQINISGSNTIMVAADMAVEQNGTVCHYPDTFGETLNFGSHSSYAWLRELDGLVPVSTADGIHWFMPAYYDAGDPEVKNGSLPAGLIKDVTEFPWEMDLAHANLSGADSDVLAEGSYVYLDFWVVSPGSDCTLRVSTGEDSNGTFVMELPRVEKTTDGHVLSQSNSQAAAMLRVGFLANSDTLVDDSMVCYQLSPGFDSRFHSLRGTYAEPGQTQQDLDSNRFSIYEPNSDYHPGSNADGDYLKTYPIALEGDVPTPVSVANRLTVQRTTRWKAAGEGERILDQLFRTAVYGKNLTAEELENYFYNSYMQGYLPPYVEKGDFFKRTSDLMSSGGTAAELDQLAAAGATDDVFIIELQRNIPQRIRMFVWLEGQDADCTNMTEPAQLMLYLEFAGSTE